MSEIIDIIYYGLKQNIMILGKYWYIAINVTDKYVTE